MNPKIIDFSASTSSTKFEDEIEFKWKTSNCEFVRLNLCKDILPAQGSIKLSLKEHIESEKIEVCIKAYGSYDVIEVVEARVIIQNEIYKNIVDKNQPKKMSLEEPEVKKRKRNLWLPIVFILSSLLSVSIFYFFTQSEISNQEIRNKIVGAYVDLGGPKVGTYSSYIDELCNTDSLKVVIHKLIDEKSVSPERFNDALKELCSTNE